MNDGPPPRVTHPSAKARGNVHWRWLAAAAILLLLGGGAATYGLASLGWLPAMQDAATADRLAAIELQVNRMEDRLSAAASRADSDALPERLSAIDDRLAKLESDETAGTAAPAASEQLETFSARLSDAQSEIRELEKRLAAFPDAAGAANSESLADMSAKIDAVSSEADAFRQQVSALRARLDSLAARFETGLGDARDRLADAERAAREAAARSLRTAYARGELLLPWLDAIEAYTGPNTELQALREIGAVPSMAALHRGLDEATRQILSADTAVEAGIVAGLLHNARKLVRVRPDGPIQGSTPEAILSRVEAALREERLADADAEWRQLPPETQQAGATWHDRLATRIAADASLDGLLNRLGTPASGPDNRS